MRPVLGAPVALLLLAPVAARAGSSLAAEVAARDVEAIKARGPAVMAELSRLYEQADAAQRATIAELFYRLGWKSADAKRALLKDVHTEDARLRLQVQWALGRVSDDDEVVDVLLDNMRHDPNPLFRDKAACALTYDQIHLAPAQTLRLYEGLIQALSDSEPQVRAIAIQSLSLRTGQDKGYRPNDPWEVRQRAIVAWQSWLREYASQVQR